MPLWLDLNHIKFTQCTVRVALAGNKSAGASKVANSTLQKVAQAAGRKSAINQKAEHVIHNLNGKIGEKNSYGHDTRNVRG